MEQQVENEETIKRFLLGDLTEEEQEQVQYRLLADREYFEQLLIVENELTDDFVRGFLSVQDRKRATEYFLAVPQRRQKLRFAMALDRYVSEEEYVSPGKPSLISSPSKHLSESNVRNRQGSSAPSQEPIGKSIIDEPASTQHRSALTWENILAEAAANRHLLSSLVESDWLGLYLVAQVQSNASTGEELAILAETSEATVTPILIRLVGCRILDEHQGIFSCTKLGGKLLERIETITGSDVQGLNQTGMRM